MTNTNIPTTVDLDSHNGLRGLCALWVLLFHSVHYGSYGNIITLNGSVAMPIFFILSGFTLTVVYGKDNGSSLNKMQFYRNRFARIYPVYFVTMLIALGLLWTDFGYLPPGYAAHMPAKYWVTLIVTNLTLTFMWLIGIPNILLMPLNGPSWFVSTLWFQYVIFPFTLPLMKRITHTKLVVCLLYIIQCVVSTLLLSFTGSFEAATMNIFSPSFCMFHAGALCGLIANESITRAENRVDEREHSLEDGNDENNDQPQDDKESNKWSTVTDVSVLAYFLLLMVSSILVPFGHDIGANFTLQIYASPLPLLFIYSLTQDKGKSYFAKLCRLSPSQWLGKVGMSLYLIHEPLIRYTATVAKAISPASVHLTSYSPIFGASMPWWGVFIVVPLALVLSVGLVRFVEEPCRRLLRTKKAQSPVATVAAEEPGIEITAKQ